jgi:hypothetical protein
VERIAPGFVAHCTACIMLSTCFNAKPVSVQLCLRLLARDVGLLSACLSGCILQVAGSWQAAAAEDLLL